jgi:thiol-disulfide isomerase/thioredoxin
MSLRSLLFIFLLISSTICGQSAHAAEPVGSVQGGGGEEEVIPSILSSTQQGVCPPGYESETCSDRTAGENSLLLPVPMGSGAFPFPLEQGTVFSSGPDRSRHGTPEVSSSQPVKKRFIVYFFWGEGCPHCADEKPFLAGLQQHYPGMDIRSYEVWHDKQNAALLANMSRAYNNSISGVPMTFVDRNVFVGFTEQTGRLIASAVERCATKPCADPLDILSGKMALKVPDREGSAQLRSSLASRSTDSLPEAEALMQQAPAGNEDVIELPLFGSIDTKATSLPLLTVMIAGMDSFNPCAFFVLLSLLGLMVHARSRGRMLFVGGVFVFFSGFIYFLFMAAWLNLFLVMGQVSLITRVAGGLSLVIAIINIKDFFLFKKGVSLTIPDSAKPKLFDRMRRLIHASSLLSLLLGTTVLAVAANSYELLCTAGFPMVYTRILTLNSLSKASYYLYLVLYNVIYVVPLLLIVVAFGVTLGKRQLTEWQGRLLKLVSGAMMLGLALVLLVNPALLNNVFVSFLLLAGALAASLVVAFVTKRWERA